MSLPFVHLRVHTEFSLVDGLVRILIEMRTEARRAKDFKRGDEVYGLVGGVGGILVLLLFGMVLWRLARIAERVPDPFAGIVVFGIFGAWFAHVVENIGMTVGVTPVTGIPLPFISYGGSFLLATYIALGIAERISTEQGKI